MAENGYPKRGFEGGVEALSDDPSRFPPKPSLLWTGPLLDPASKLTP